MGKLENGMDYRKGNKTRIRLSRSAYKKNGKKSNITIWHERRMKKIVETETNNNVVENDQEPMAIGDMELPTLPPFHNLEIVHTSTPEKVLSPSISSTLEDSNNNELTNSANDLLQSEVVEGRRIVDIKYFLNQLKLLNNHSPLSNCSLNDMEIVKENRKGFVSVLWMKCSMCNFSNKIYSTEASNTSEENMDINTSAVNAIIGIGSSYSHLNEICTTLDIPCMKSQTFQHIQNNLSMQIEANALEKMKEAAEEEKLLAVQNGDVGPDGTPEITVVCDGTWAKRSYRFNYNSLSGAAAIIGFRTKKILYLGVKNKFCMICEKLSSTINNETTGMSNHRCYKNWNGSASGMEAAILVEGFRNSETMYGIRYTKFIGDGDSSCYKKILDARPYGFRSIEKIECRNHLLRNFCNKLRDLTRNTKMGHITMRRKIKMKILKMRIAISKAIQYRKTQESNFQTKAKNLKEDILNTASHIFGEHKRCAELGYFCLKTIPDENNVVPELIEHGLYEKIIDFLRYLSNHSRSLIYDVDSNIVEQFNSVICKMVGGKRLNFVLRGQYQARCSAAAITFNSKKSLFYNMHKFICKNSPKSKFYKRFEERRKRKNSNCKRRLFKEKTFATNNDTEYGPTCQKPDMTEQQYEEAKADFLKSLQRTQDELHDVEKRTYAQAESREWHDERRKIITASNFARICKRRRTTKCGNIVKSILYSANITSLSLEYGKINENKAKECVQNNNNVVINECGLFINLEEQYLGATPDGVIGERGIIEIKCPYSAKNMTPEEAVRQRKITFWTNNGKGFEKNKKHNWYYQIQGQLNVTNRDYCVLVVWTPLGMKIETIFRDEDFWRLEMVPKLRYFYFNCLLPELIDPRFSRNMSIREPNEITNI